MNGKASKWLIAGMAIAGITAATQAANPAREKHKAAADAIAANKAAAIDKQPKTMAQAYLTQFRTRSGGTAVRVPTQLWSALGAQKRADGSIAVTEGDGNAQPPAKVEELPHE